jgi:hypothetical protein
MLTQMLWGGVIGGKVRKGSLVVLMQTTARSPTILWACNGASLLPLLATGALHARTDLGRWR